MKILVTASLARDKLGWRPRVDIQQGLASTVEFFRRELKRQAAP